MYALNILGPQKFWDQMQNFAEIKKAILVLAMDSGLSPKNEISNKGSVFSFGLFYGNSD